MNKLLRSEKGRLLLGAAALAIVIALGCVLPVVRLDWTAGQVVTPDAQAEALIRGLETPVRIYRVTSDEDSDMWLSELLRRYAGLSDRLTVETVSPSSPRFALVSRHTNGETLDEGSLIVCSEQRSAVLSAADLYSAEYDMMMLYYYGQYVPTRMDYVAQTALFNAIHYVSREDMPAVYLLSGHGDTGLDSLIYGAMRAGNLDLRTLNLAAAGAVPEDAAVVIVSGVRAALSEAECAALKAWLADGGRMILLTDYQSDLTNLSELTAWYGMAQKDGVVLDNDAQRLYSADYKHFLKPEVMDTAFTATVKALGAAVVVPTASALTHSDVRRAGLNAAPLFKTSDRAYIKANTARLTTLEQESGDEAGLFAVGMAAAEGETRLIWLTSTAIFSETANQVSGGANRLLLNDLLAALTTPTEGIELNGVDLMAEVVELPMIPALLGLLALPLAFALAALVLGIRKRAKA